MENLKIRVNSADESKEAQELFFKLGGKWGAGGCDIKYTNEPYLYLENGLVLHGFSAENFSTEKHKEITLPELRAMVNPMKEYLEPMPNGEYKYHSNASAVGGEWIAIPEGAIRARFYPHDPDELEFENSTFQWWHDGNNKWRNYENYSNTLKHSRVVWQREQDEPFLTPECTLNDQYSEIEQVGQVEIHGTAKAKPDFNFGAAQAIGGVDATLAERQSQYGCYEDVAHVTQQILSALRIGNYDELPAPMKESLHMIASKMARIVNGDPEYLDNWHDIGGYAKLIEKLIKGE